MAQSRFRKPKRAAGGGEATPINHLHEIEEVVEVEHRAVHLPMYWIIGLNIADFLSDRPATSFHPGASADQRRISTCSVQENVMADQVRAYEPLTSENAALVLIDHQVGLMTGVRDYSTGELKHNVV